VKKRKYQLASAKARRRRKSISLAWRRESWRSSAGVWRNNEKMKSEKLK
jgi:hypothetical protein